jgi:hypothetical protein
MDLTKVALWVTASITKFAQERRQDVPLYIETQERLTSKVPRYLELKIDGPQIVPGATKGEYCVEVGLYILVATTGDEKDVYHLPKLMGIAAQLLNSNICVYKFGDGDSLLGVLQLNAEPGIEAHTFGDIKSPSDYYQGAVEAQYTMRLP